MQNQRKPEREVSYNMQKIPDRTDFFSGNLKKKNENRKNWSGDSVEQDIILLWPNRLLIIVLDD